MSPKTMNLKTKLATSPTLPHLLTDEAGQMLPVIAFMMVAILAMTGFSVDLGRALYTHRQLQTSTDAAAMAGAQLLPSSGAVVAAAQYSALPGSLNAQPNLGNVTMVSGYPAIKCLATLTSQGQACVAPGNGNAIAVKQQVTIPLFFMRVIGKSSLTLIASATASMQGSVSSPYNVVIVVDSTGSMNNADSGSNCHSSRITCALAGVQVLLQNLSPCGSSQTSCGTVDTYGNVTNAVDRVSLYTFPAVSSAADAQSELDCSGNRPSISAYTYPALPLYQIVGFSSDYRSSDSNKALTSGSSLVRAAGGKANCAGMQAIGGAGTYYAGVIYAAQAALVAQAGANPGTKNILILLSDGDASAPTKKMPGALTTGNGTYPSTINQCQQAVTAAQAATAAGTRVYTVAYGANDSGCGTDVSGNQPGITPCQTMEQIASVPQNFFSDAITQNGSSPCISAAQPTSSLNQIFVKIAGTMTVGRLISDNTP